MSSILCIETATDICSVCIARDNSLLGLRETTKGMSHTSLTSVFVQELLEETGISIADLAAVAVSGGPGSYTGLRVGVSIAKGICAGAGLPFLAINTLESLAKKSIDTYAELDEKGNNLHLAMIDARRMEVYMAAYDGQGARIMENAPYIIVEDSFQKWLESYDNIILSGNGTQKTLEFLDNEALIDAKIQCSAVNLIHPAFERLKAGKFDDLAYYSPNYIKSPNITKPRKALF